MAEFLDQFLNKRRPRPSASSDETVSSPETKKSKKSTSPIQSGPQHEDEVITALNMSQDLAATLKSILEKLEKLDVIESSLKKIESKLENLERRTEKLEGFQATTKKDIDDLKAERKLLWGGSQGESRCVPESGHFDNGSLNKNKDERRYDK